jgi:hypothetical protein
MQIRRNNKKFSFTEWDSCLRRNDGKRMCRLPLPDSTYLEILNNIVRHSWASGKLDLGIAGMTGKECAESLPASIYADDREQKRASLRRQESIDSMGDQTN